MVFDELKWVSNLFVRIHADVILVFVRLSCPRPPVYPRIFGPLLMEQYYSVSNQHDPFAVAI